MSVQQEKFTEIANAIREKTGTTDLIKPSEFASKVDDVYEAGKQAQYDEFWDRYQLNGKRVNYAHAFAGNCWTSDLLHSIKYTPIVFPAEATVNTRNCLSMFSYLNWSYDEESQIDLTEICKKIDFSNCKSAQQVFENAKAINITVDFSNCEKLVRVFTTTDGGNLDNIRIKISEKATNIDAQCFRNTSLQNFEFLEGSVVGTTLTFQYSTKLTVESAKNIINTLKNYAGTDNSMVHTLTLSSTTWDILEASGAAPNGGSWKDYVNSIGWNYA